MENSLELMKLTEYAIKLAAKKRYTESEIRKKIDRLIKKKELDEGLVEGVVSRLKELKYINDEKFVEDYVSDRVRFKPRGKRMISFELRRKGVAPEMIDELIEKSEVDEVAMAKSLLERKERKWEKLSGRERKNKAYQFLGSKGFSGDSIYKAIGSWYDQAN